MSLPVILRQETAADIQETREQLETVRVGLGNQFLARVRDVLSRRGCLGTASWSGAQSVVRIGLVAHFCSDPRDAGVDAADDDGSVSFSIHPQAAFPPEVAPRRLPRPRSSSSGAIMSEPDLLETPSFGQGTFTRFNHAHAGTCTQRRIGRRLAFSGVAAPMDRR